jgi:hypothetical protein
MVAGGGEEGGRSSAIRKMELVRSSRRSSVNERRGGGGSITSSFASAVREDQSRDGGTATAGTRGAFPGWIKLCPSIVVRVCVPFIDS